MKNINITRNFKGLEISMCVMGAYTVADMDYEFSIKGANLPMVNIGKISAYCDGGKLILDDFKDVIGSDIYVPLTYGRVCQGDDDIYPSYTDIFEGGVDYGMYDITDDKYKIINYDKDEIVSVLFDMAKECQRLYAKSLNITQRDVINVSKMLKGKEGTYAIRYYEDKDNGNLVFGDMYGFGLFEIDIEKDMSTNKIASLICEMLEIEFIEEADENNLNHSLIKCCGTCVEFAINKEDGYCHCTHFGTPMNMLNQPCKLYSEYNRNIIQEILQVEDFVL